VTDLIDVDAENFMTGLKVVFDRERSVLGWQKFDCKIGHAPLVVALPDWMKSTALSEILNV
jgi:hypothetical protein